jgi:predicted MFS family arabinose efflux permease
MSLLPTCGAGLGQVFRIPEFRALWSAELVSIAGDQLARVGLSVLVYGRTGSPLWAALTYALTFLPALAGGVLLGRLADRHPRRTVMIVCDAARAALVAVMALPGVPLPAVCALLVAVVLISPVHAAAQGALLPEIAPGVGLEKALAVRHLTNQGAQVGGFVLGGLLVAVLSPAAALGLNAATFAISALVLRLGVAARPAPMPDGGVLPVSGAPSWLADTREGLHTVVHDPRRRVLVGLVWLVGCSVVPEALAVPYAEQLGLDTSAAGMLMAADPAGSVLGAWAFVRFVPERLRHAVVGPLAVAAAVPLGLCALLPGPGATVLLWGTTGACATACLVQCQADFVRATPPHVRGRAIAVAASGLVGVQGLAMLLSGWAAEVWGARAAVAMCGVAGFGLAVAFAGVHAQSAMVGDCEFLPVDAVRVSG